MTYLFNDPATFMEDMREGFLDAFPQYVIGVDGGVVRATVSDTPKVAVVVGGGSGHYPAFCGVVGPGFADGAVIGNIFTSPSVHDVYSVAAAADNGAGVLLTAGNYAGDKINFELAAQRLQADGIDARVFLVTDDIASAPAGEHEKRRGIAGDFTVFKLASAAAEEGADLDTVVDVARRANGLTRTLGVAFDGCTMPGARQPLFGVPDGQMSIGLGIHGEPGIGDVPLPTAAQLADLFVDRLVEERPVTGGKRIAVVLNGLGTVKYEELFVVWRSVAQRLRALDYEIVEPEIGELVTSLDMAGCSLTITWLDDELERYWKAPASTPAYLKGSTSVDGRPRDVSHTSATSAVHDASDYARGVAALLHTAVTAARDVVVANEDELAAIDAVAGDGDHGRGMVRGLNAATEAIDDARARGAGASDALAAAGDAWSSRAGGTSGVLWGSALTAAAQVLGTATEPYAGPTVSQAVDAAVAAIGKLGGAQAGDKTMLDAMLPFAEILRAGVERGEDVAAAWAAAADAAADAAQATADLVPRVGRARPLAARSVGTPDPGARSFALIAQAVSGISPSHR